MNQSELLLKEAIEIMEQFDRFHISRPQFKEKMLDGIKKISYNEVCHRNQEFLKKVRKLNEAKSNV